MIWTFLLVGKPTLRVLESCKILYDLQTIFMAFFGVWLNTVDIPILNCRYEFISVVRFPYGISVITNSMKRMDKVEVEFGR